LTNHNDSITVLIMNSKFLSVRLPEELVDCVDKLAKKQIRSRSNMIEVLLQECVELHRRELDEIEAKG